ncbi:DUF6907 domain-containing protein [Streptomyces xiamenensis]|uniref:DUF6907 domain-containing protein n=1 Tax=Streptomyces xiamenensis TaxID=408015 RepID=UPI0036E74F06
MTETSLPRPECPQWCATDHEPEMPHAAEEGYLHVSAPYRVHLPSHPELDSDRQRDLTLDVVAMQRPGSAPEPARIELSLQGANSRTDESFAVIAGPLALDQALDQLRQAAAALETWRGLLESRPRGD